MENKTVKQPVRRGRAKVPVVMQMETLECGAASLAMVMAYYGKWVPLEQVRLDCGVSRDGSNAKNVLVAARSYGFDAQGFRCEVGALKKDMSYPCIIHWNFNHFVVLDGFKGDWAPASASRSPRGRTSSRAASPRARSPLPASALSARARRWPL